MTFEWDAMTYDDLRLPHVAWGQRVLDRLGDVDDRRVLDAGCGTGRDAAALIERHPGVDLVGVDASVNMIEQARTRLGDRADLVVADLTRPIPVEPVDAVMSVAAFHWVKDHDALFANLASITRPGGRLVSDCGGQGQLAVVEAAIEEVTGELRTGWGFRGVAETEASLLGGGWEPRAVELRADPLRLDDPDLLESYLAAVVLGGYLDDMDEGDRVPFVRAVRKAMAEPVIDYVRLEIDATRR